MARRAQRAGGRARQRLTLQGLPFRLAQEGEAGEEALAVAGEADLVEGDAEEEDDGGDDGFGFGDGYDLVLKQPTGDLCGIPDETALVDAAIEADSLQLGSGEGCVGENDLVQIVIVVGPEKPLRRKWRAESPTFSRPILDC